MSKEKKNKKEEGKKKKKEEFSIDSEQMTRAGLHFGHKVSVVHPKMKPYIFGARNGVHIIDLEKTLDKFKKTLEFIKKIISEDKVLLFVGTKIQLKDLTEDIALKCGLPYVKERWLGGTLTNFGTIKKRIDYFKELEEKKKKGEFKKYTKKEQSKIDKELRDLEIKFGGIKKLEKIPDVIFVLDMKNDALAVKEARSKGVVVVGIVDTNVDPGLADYLIPANDDAISSVGYILEKVKEAILKSKTKDKKEK